MFGWAWRAGCLVAIRAPRVGICILLEMNPITIQKRKTEKVITLLSASHILRNYPTRPRALRAAALPAACAVRNISFSSFGVCVCVFLFVVSSCADYSCIVCEVVAASSRAQRFKMTARKVLRLKFVSSFVAFVRKTICCVQGLDARSNHHRTWHNFKFPMWYVVGGRPLIGLYSLVINFSKLISSSHQQAKLDSQQQRLHCSHNSKKVGSQCHRNQSSGESKFSWRVPAMTVDSVLCVCVCMH